MKLKERHYYYIIWDTGNRFFHGPTFCFKQCLYDYSQNYKYEENSWDKDVDKEELKLLDISKPYAPAL